MVPGNTGTFIRIFSCTPEIPARASPPGRHHPGPRWTSDAIATADSWPQHNLIAVRHRFKYLSSATGRSSNFQVNSDFPQELHVSFCQHEVGQKCWTDSVSAVMVLIAELD